MSTERIMGEQCDSSSWIVMRSSDVLKHLPFDMRWEVTRRHPYYLAFWEAASRFHSRKSSNPQQAAVDQASALLLQGIAVAGSCPAPGTDWQGLEGVELSQLWREGAVYPVTMRGLVGMLLVALPGEALAEVSELMRRAATATRDDAHTYETLSALTSLRHPALDSIPHAPVVSVNLQAPQRTIVQALENMVREWKQERNIPERRRRDDKLEDYLVVFDMREGWAGDRYDSGREKTLREAASFLNISHSTACNRYQAAFRLIAGHDYTPELWLKLFGRLKLGCTSNPGEPSRHAMRRPWRSRHLRPVPETTLAPPAQDTSENDFLNTLAISSDEIEQLELSLDIRTLIEQGRSNEQILASLDLGPTYGDVIDYLRARHADQL